MGLAHVASADDADADLSHISLCFEIQFATGCKISILGIGVSQAAFWPTGSNPELPLPTGGYSAHE
jgi:hypothetical protein